MKAKEIRGMDNNMLNEKVLELKKELIKVNAQVAIGTAIKNPRQVREIKKTLARILTISNQKDLKKTKQSEADKKHE
jgi:large subunit ribosomal protein L29